MLPDLVLLLGGLAALYFGGGWLVRGASALARSLGVTPLVIGLTVVAFGTSMPELVVNLAAAFRGSADLGFGNVVGSNIANLGLLLALTALLRPIPIDRGLVVYEIPLMIGAALLALVLALLGGDAPGFGPGDGLVLLLFFALFMGAALGRARGPGPLHPEGSVPAGASHPDSSRTAPDPPGGVSTGGGWRITVWIVAGLAALFLGGEGTVRGAVGLATGVGISDAVVGLTVVAVGTSLPEFATTLTAARQGQVALAVGNVVGSNLFNIAFIWGVTVLVAPAALPDGGVVDLAVMVGLSMILLPLALSGRVLGRGEGALLLVLYLGYLGFVLVR